MEHDDGSHGVELIPFVVVWKSSAVTLKFNPSSPVRALLEYIENSPELGSVALPTQKLVLRGKALTLETHANVTIADAGISKDDRLLLVGSNAKDVEDVRAAKEEYGIRGFNDESRREWQRRNMGEPAVVVPSGPYTFQAYRALDIPAREQALGLLHKLASDPGIQAVMQKHKWTVGLLSEMPPEGKVGVSAVCVLGVNVNAGQEISLRLRTDDLRGFRKYLRIKETLIHELAHMVHADHGLGFKQLNSQLTKEAQSLDWTSRGGSTLAGAREIRSAEEEGDPVQEWVPDENNPDDVMLVTAQTSGQRLGGEGATGPPTVVAAEAALRRAGVGEGVSQTQVPPSSPPQAPAVEAVLDTTASHPRPPPSLPSSSSQDWVAAGDAGRATQGDGAVAAAPQAIPPPAIDEPTAAPMVLECPVCGADLPGGERAMSAHVDAHFASSAGEGSDGSEPVPAEAAEAATGDAGEVEDEQLRLLQESAGAAGAKAEQAVDRLIRACPAAHDSVAALETLDRVIGNALRHPEEEKFRRVRASNLVFVQRVGRWEGGVAVLAAAGFVRDDEALRLQRNDPGLLWLVQAAVRAGLRRVGAQGGGA